MISKFKQSNSIVWFMLSTNVFIPIAEFLKKKSAELMFFKVIKSTNSSH
jgi:hypothetical protein